MATLDFIDRASDPAAWAAELSISREAVDLYLASDVIDLHVDSFIWTRVFGYDLTERHDHGLLGARVYSQVDFPRILEANVTGATWVITTNPVRASSERTTTFEQNLVQLLSIFDGVSDAFAVVRTAAEYRAARKAKKHGAFIGVQGGNAFDANPSVLDRFPPLTLLRVTLVHLSSSTLGSTSSPLGAGRDAGLSRAGRSFIEMLNERKIFVDLAHISKKGFWDAMDVRDKTQPVIVTHTGVSGVFEHWRNLDDDQLRAIADSGGTVGVMYQSSFLGDPYLGGKAERIAEHLEHIVKVAGEDCASLGSDWDGAILPPRDMPTCLELPRLVDILLARGMKPVVVEKILGKSFLRVVEALRG